MMQCTKVGCGKTYTNEEFENTLRKVKGTGAAFHRQCTCGGFDFTPVPSAVAATTQKSNVAAPAG